MNESVAKLEGLLKINNFIRRKEMEARESGDLLRHKLDKADKERLSMTKDCKKQADQIRYL